MQNSNQIENQLEEACQLAYKLDLSQKYKGSSYKRYKSKLDALAKFLEPV